MVVSIKDGDIGMVARVEEVVVSTLMVVLVEAQPADQEVKIEVLEMKMGVALGVGGGGNDISCKF